MDYVREAIEYLKSYNDLARAKENLMTDIRELKAVTGEISANLDGMPHGGGGSGYDDRVINKLYRLQVAEENYKETVKNMTKIEKVLDDLNEGFDNELHGKLLRMWFIENKTKEDIADELFISVRHVFRIKNQAIRRLAIQLFGIRVIK